MIHLPITVIGRAMEMSIYQRIRNKYILRKVESRVFEHDYAELHRGFTLTADLLGERTLVLKHKVCYRLEVTRTLKDLPDNEVWSGCEVQTTYDHRNTYFFEAYETVNIDRPMDLSADDPVTYRDHYLRKFQKKLEYACLKKSLWKRCLAFVQQSSPEVKMVKCLHQKDGQVCQLFKELTTKVNFWL